MIDAPAKPKSSVSLIRAWVTQQVRGCDEVDIPTLTSQAVSYVKADPARVEAILNDALRSIAYTIAQEVIASTRGRNQVVTLGDVVTTKAGLRRQGKRLQLRWELFMERAGGREVRLMQMTAAELEEAEKTRRENARPELMYADLWKRLRLGMEVGQTVGQVYDAEAIEVIYQHVVEQLEG